MAQENNFKINEAFVDELYNSAQSVVHNELKSHFLLGDTEEFDNFIPDSVELDTANAYDIFRLACCQYVGYRTEENENEAENNWLKASTMGDANAMLELSVCLFTELKYEEGFKELFSKMGVSTDWDIHYKTVSPSTIKIIKLTIIKIGLNAIIPSKLNVISKKRLNI